MEPLMIMANNMRLAMGGFRVLAVLVSITWTFDSVSGQENAVPEQFGGANEIQKGFGEGNGISKGMLHERLYGEKVDEQEAVSSPAPAALKNLLSDQLEERLQAFEILHRDRVKISKAIVNNIEKLSTNPSRSMQGRFNMHLIAAGRLRIKEAIPLLVPMIDFHLDPETFPVGVFSPMFYPVADTLVDIGGRDVARAVVDVLSEPADPHRLFVSAWVLQEVLGREAARAVINQAMERATVSPRHSDNLSRIEKLLREERLSLRGWFPERVRERLRRSFSNE